MLLDKISIDLAGSQGNAFYILGMAQKLGKQMGKTPEEVKALHNEMTSGDYDHLLKVFIKNFGMVVKLKNRR